MKNLKLEIITLCVIIFLGGILAGMYIGINLQEADLIQAQASCEQVCIANDYCWSYNFDIARNTCYLYDSNDLVLDSYIGSKR